MIAQQKNQDRDQRVAELRSLIRTTRAERVVTAECRRSRSEVASRVGTLVAAWGERGQGGLARDLAFLASGGVPDLLKVRGHVDEGGQVHVATFDLGPLLTAILGPKAICDAILRDIDAVPVGWDNAAHIARLARLDRELDTLEIEEERLIEQSEAEGRPISRRADARPEIVLGMVDAEGGSRA